VEKSDCIMNLYSGSRWPWKWIKIFFHLLGRTILNGSIFLAQRGSTLSHKLCRLTFVTDLIQEMGRVPQTRTTGQETSPIDQRTRKLDTWHNKHPSLEGKTNDSLPIFFLKQWHKNEIQVSQCKMGLCAGSCLEVCQTELHFWGSISTKLDKHSIQRK
jgi:hypothetical protein